MLHAKPAGRQSKLFVKCCLFGLCLTLSLSSAANDTGENDDPFACLGQAEGLSVKEIRDGIKKRLHANYSDALNNCITADLMRRVGDSQTARYFQNAIAADRDEGAYELFYADYLRIFRGPGRPLFSQVEKHYFLALNSLARRKTSRPWDGLARSRVQRALIALYQEDGVTIATRSVGNSLENVGEQKPLVFFSTINRYAQSTADLDREPDDIRDYTSEALFSASKSKNGKPLNRADLKALVRIKTPFDRAARLRFRSGNLPSIDVFGTYRHTPNDAVNNFFSPDVFNGLVLYSYGVTSEKPFSFGKNLDVDIVGTFRDIRQRGLLEFIPAGIEAIRSHEIKAAVSKFFGPDKVILQFNYAYQSIHAETNDRPNRDREFTGATFTYQLLRPHGFRSPYDRRFEVRSWDFFGGFLIDNEAFNDKLPANNVTDIRRDYFGGVALKGMGPFDVTIQPTIFSLSSSNPDRAPASNSQYRTNVTVLYRVVDEECTPDLPVEVPIHNAVEGPCRSNAVKRFAQERHAFNLAFWQLVVPLRHDIALHNLDVFENYKVGIQSDWKLFTVPRRTTLLTSIGYDFQRFYRLNKNENILNLSLKIGF